MPRTGIEPSRHLRAVSLLSRLVAPMAITLLLWLTSTNDVTASQVACSFVVLSAATWMYSSWKLHTRRAFPILALVVAIYWWYFTFELFWGGREVQSWQTGSVPVTGQAITATMIAVAIGVMALLLGGQTRAFPSLERLKQWDLIEDPKHWTWLRIVLAVGTLTMLRGLPLAFLGEGLRQSVVLFETMVPSVAFAILFRNYLQGRASTFDKILIVSFTVLRFVGGMASGWLGSSASMAMIAGGVYLSERRRVPAWAPALLAAYVLFFQVGKNEYRQRYWFGQQANTTNPVGRLSYWFDASLSEWQKAFAVGDKEAYVGLISQSLMRTSLLTQVANVIERTPDDVPFQKGKTYSYFLVTWIPRFLWPDKPFVSGANQFYQVAYGLTREDSLDQVSIAVGSLGEAYMNFGWIGILLIMFLIGVVLSVYQRLFLSRTSGVFLFGIGVALVPQILTIEAQLAQYLAGVLQQIVFCVVVFSPLLRRRRPFPQRLLRNRCDFPSPLLA
jgi:hypothetical protein